MKLAAFQIFAVYKEGILAREAKHQPVLATVSQCLMRKNQAVNEATVLFAKK